MASLLEEAGAEVIRIESDGSVMGTRIFLDDQDISNAVTGVRWHHEVSDLPRAEIEVQLIGLVAHNGEVVWHGIEALPDAVLLQEIERRGLLEEVRRD